MPGDDGGQDLAAQEVELSKAVSEDLDLKEIVNEIPDEILIGSLVDRINREPENEGMKVVSTTHSFSGPILPPVF